MSAVNHQLLATLIAAGFAGVISPRLGFACLAIFVVVDIMAGRFA